MRIALDGLPTDTDVLHRLVRDMAGALDESGTEIDRLRLIIRQFQRAQLAAAPSGSTPTSWRWGWRTWTPTWPARRRAARC